MQILIGVDIGTTNMKVLAFAEDGSLVASAKAATPTIDEASQEMSPAVLWETCARLIRQVVGRLHGDQPVAGIAVASFGEAGVLVDQGGLPLSIIIPWYDRRPEKWVAWWKERLPAEEIYRITGLPLDHTYSVHKILHLREQQPGLFETGATWLCVADWITFNLTGERATSPSIASRTMMFDLNRMDWSPEILSLAKLPPGLLPPLRYSGEVVGRVTGRAAALTGLAEGTPVAAGGHDHICAAIAAGVVAPGSFLSSSGTTEAFFTPLDRPVFSAGLPYSGICCGCHTVRGKYYLLAGIMSGMVVEWVCRLLLAADEPDCIDELLKTGAAAEQGAKGVLFVPDLVGRGAPAPDPAAWGAWLGLRLDTGRAEMARSAMEGLAFRIRQMFDEMVRVSGQSVPVIRCVGGGTRSAWLQQLKSNVYGVSLETLSLPEATAQGAAILAGVGAGVYADIQAASAMTRQATTRFDPQPEAVQFYDQVYKERFLRLNPEGLGDPQGLQKLNL
jgi:xylulokinase